ncbi:restriction endonuclease subunit S [Desulfocurvibacter africanus]|uniref:restriction endonuclease subunit S n=1 Tax=Desulfocurvibacter africanus TaxID=873 RepID=UPI00040CEB16|nr:restriction endonuclease subunit S [Desulfocurvibacter africanus]
MTEATRNLLEQHFDTAFAAPDGIAKLRELILKLAIQGKLVEQNPNDPLASELLKEIEAEKQRLVKTGKIKKATLLPPIKPEELPYELPQGWEWVRMGNAISYMDAGWSPKCENEPAKDSEWGVLKTTAVQTLQFWPHENKALPAKLAPRPDAQVEEDDILITRAGPKNRVGICCVAKSVRPQLMLSDKIIRLKIHRNLILPVYCALALNTGYGADQIERMKSGMADSQMNISQDKVKQVTIALPPLPEQHRIIARIDQLMARCDEVEKLRQNREEKRLAVHATAIKQLLDAPDGSTWGFIQQHFGELYTVKENVAELRKAILQLAVMGRLVPQDPNDPPASELLKEIEVEKQRLVKAGKIKQPKPLPPIKAEEVPYQLPQGWEWVRLGEAMLKITDGTHHSPPNKETGEFLYISAKNIKDDGVLLSNATYVTKEIHEEIFSRCNPEYGNILYIKDGATTGVVTINNLKDPFSMLSSVALLKQPQQVDNRYLLFTLRSPYFYKEMRAEMMGVAITRVTLKKLQDAIVPLPPLPEQHRIVAKIDQLMALCDSLDQQIDAATSKQTELLNAVMAQV